MRVQLRFVRLVWQTRDTNSAVALVTNVQANQQRGNLFENARVFELATVDGTYAGNFCGQPAHGLDRLSMVAADDHIAFYWSIAIQKISGNVLEGSDYGNVGQKLGSFLRCRTLPNSQRARGASANACS